MQGNNNSSSNAVPGSRSGTRRTSRRSLVETEEQKQLKLEMKLMKEEEQRKKKAEQIRLKLEARIQEEERISHLNKLKIQEEWRKIMRMAKSESLKKEIEVLSQTHERLTDRKDAIIQRLEKTLEEVEEQYQLAIRSHLQNIDALINLHDARVDALESEFERDLKELEAEFSKEREEIIAKHQNEKEELLDITDAMEQQFNQEELEAKHLYQTQRDEIKNRNAEEFASLRSKLDLTILKLEKEFDQANATYTTQTEVSITKLKQLTHTDENNTKIIEANNRKLQRLQKNLNHWRTKMANNVRECEQRNKALKEEKDAIASHFQHLKGRMAKFREKHTGKLAELTKNTDACIKSLSQKLKMAEKILTVAEMNLKLETEKEKVLPYYRSENDEELQIDDAELQKKIQQYCTTTLTAAGEPVGEWNYLDNFYKRYNKVVLDKMALDQEKAKLNQENQDLRAILKQYLDGISVSNEVINQANPLLIINGRVSDTIRVTERAEQPARPPVTQRVLVNQITS